MTALSSESTPNNASPSRFLRPAWLAAGGLAIAAAGVGAGLALRPAAQPAAETVAAAKAEEAGAKAKTTQGKSAAARHGATGTSGSDTTPLATQHAAVCAHCGVIEGVREIKVKGEGTGIGAVAGGVLGAAVGNQMGRGDGRKAMTVIGAVGGGLAGHEVEKRARSETLYEVRVRMDDGSVRTLKQKTAPTPGSRVTVEGNTLRAAGSQSGEGQMMRTSTGV